MYPQTIGYRDNPNSKAIAEWLETTGHGKRLRDKVLHIVMTCGDDGATTEEVSRYLGIYNSSVGARFRELELGQAIVKTDVTRKVPGGSRDVAVYVATGNKYVPQPQKKKKSPWQPIGSAPIDGTIIYGYNKKYKQHYIMKYIESMAFFNSGWHHVQMTAGGAGVENSALIFGDEQPDLWTPLLKVEI